MIGLTKGESSSCHVSKCILNYNSSVRAKLRDCNLEEGFDFAKNFFVRCFYVGYEGDPENVEKGFLRSTLLVQVRLKVLYFHGWVLIAIR